MSSQRPWLAHYAPDVPADITVPEGSLADMLDTANSYDDKVALLRMLVQEDSGRVANVLKNMIKRDMAG